MGRTTQHPLSCVTDYPGLVNKYEAHKLTFAYLKSYTTTHVILPTVPSMFVGLTNPIVQITVTIPVYSCINFKVT